MQRAIDKMATMYPMLILMGFMIVGVSLILGIINSQAAVAYYSEPKPIRETVLTATRASIESTDLWLPYFKFLGIGLILSGIVMALRVIIDRLQAAGREVLGTLPPEKRPALPAPPWFGLFMPIVMMTGWVIFIVALVVSLGLAGTAAQLYANPIPEIDAAGQGTLLLSQLQALQATSAWLIPFKFFGVATEFLAITMGLGIIIYILGGQTKLLDQGISLVRGKPARATTQPNEQVAA
jgi:hypothetical protein